MRTPLVVTVSHKQAGRKFTFRQVSPTFDLPMREAAQKFRCCVSGFKKKCRSIGIRRWPYRTLISLRKHLFYCEQALLNKLDSIALSALRLRIAKVKKEIQDIYLEPHLIFCLDAKKQKKHTYQAYQTEPGTLRQINPDWAEQLDYDACQNLLGLQAIFASRVQNTIPNQNPAFHL